MFADGKKKGSEVVEVETNHAGAAMLVAFRSVPRFLFSDRSLSQRPGSENEHKNQDFSPSVRNHITYALHTTYILNYKPKLIVMRSIQSAEQPSYLPLCPGVTE